MREIKRGDIFYCNFGEHLGSVQNGRRPALVVQADDFNQNAPTVIVAAVTSVTKKLCMPSHIVLPMSCGLADQSMVMLEQIRTVNKSDLSDYIGHVGDERSWKAVNCGLKKAFGMWYYNPRRVGEIMCLCPRCLSEYKYVTDKVVRRLDPFQKAKDRCTTCDGLGFDYVVFDKTKAQ